MSNEKQQITQDTFSVEWIACKNLSVIWAQAQRPYRESRAKEIAANFDPDLFDPLKVTKPNGKGVYHVCDGQTRKGAVEMMWGADAKVPCLVAKEGDPKRAAEIFLETNTGRRPPSNIDNFKVSVCAEREIETAINRIVRHNKYRVESHIGDNIISAVAALRFVFTVCSAGTLNETLRMLRDIWQEDRNATVGPMVRGFGVFLNEFGAKIDRPKFIEVTKKKWMPLDLLREVKSERHVHGGSVTEMMVLLLTQNYNKSQRGGNQLRRKQLPRKTADAAE